QGPWAWAAFGWLGVCVIAAFAAAIVGRRVTSFGTSGILVLVLYAILLFVAANLVNQGASAGLAEVSFAFGFFGAIVGSALIEAGSRVARPAPEPERKPVPAAGSGETVRTGERR
ncbi:MAG: hypothetical protein ACT4OI_09035, partial [Methanobacteriota archaeon]